MILLNITMFSITSNHQFKTWSSANAIIFLFIVSTIVILTCNYRVSSPLKLVSFLIFEIWTKNGVIKNCSEIGGLVERGDSLRKGGGFPNYFISFPSEKHVFITVGILFFSFFVWQTFSLAVINRSILSSGLLSTRKWYIKFLFLLLLFLNIFFVKIWIFWAVREVKGQKLARNEK